MSGEPESRFANPLELEANATARLCHENIVKVHDVGTWGGVYFQLMERLQGNSLASVLRNGPLPPRRALAVVADVARAVEHAHSRGVLHLDLKPGNVHIGDAGEVKLIDFGTGTAYRVRGRKPDREGGIAGTPAYMAPEQWRSSPLGPRTDSWGLGLLLHECLTGRLPLSGQHLGLLPDAEDGPCLPAVAAELGLPTIVDQAIQLALQTEPKHRLSVAQFLGMLEVVTSMAHTKQLANLSFAEMTLAATVLMLQREVTLSDVIRLSGLSRATARLGLSRLVALGIVHEMGEGAAYNLADERLARCCLEQLPLVKQGLLLNRVINAPIRKHAHQAPQSHRRVRRSLG